MYEKAKKEQRDLIKKEIQKIFDKYSECDSHYHQESEYNEKQPDYERDQTEEQNQDGLEPAVSLENQMPFSEKL